MLWQVFQVFDFGRGSNLDSAGGANSVPPEPIGGFKGAYFRLNTKPVSY